MLMSVNLKCPTSVLFDENALLTQSCRFWNCFIRGWSVFPTLTSMLFLSSVWQVTSKAVNSGIWQLALLECGTCSLKSLAHGDVKFDWRLFSEKYTTALLNWAYELNHSMRIHSTFSHISDRGFSPSLIVIISQVRLYVSWSEIPH